MLRRSSISRYCLPGNQDTPSYPLHRLDTGDNLIRKGQSVLDWLNLFLFLSCQLRKISLGRFSIVVFKEPPTIDFRDFLEFHHTVKPAVNTDQFSYFPNGQQCSVYVRLRT